MNTVTTSRAPEISIAAHTLSKWKKLTVASLIASALLLFLLVAVFLPFVAKSPMEPAPIAVLIGNLVLAGMVVRIPRSWPSLAAAVFLFVALLGALPHDLPALIHPDDPGHFIFSLLNFGVAGFGIYAGMQSYRVDRRTHGGRQALNTR